MTLRQSLGWSRAIKIAALLALAFPVVAWSETMVARDENGKALPGAWIVSTRSECVGLGHCSTYCVDVQVARTRDDGSYSVGTLFHQASEFSTYAYREGYEQLWRSDQRSTGVTMKRGGTDPRYEKLDRETARVMSLADLAGRMSCFAAPARQREALLPVYRAMYREARSVGRLPEHRKLADGICYEIHGLARSPGEESRSPDEERRSRDAYLKGVEPTCLDPVGDVVERALLEAVKSGDVGYVRYQAKRGFDMNRRLDGYSPLISVAAASGSVAMITSLAESGARPDEPDLQGRAALERTLRETPMRLPRPVRLSTVKAMLDAGADPNRRDIGGFPPLVRVADEIPGDVSLFELLAARGARIDLPVQGSHSFENGRTVLLVARDPEMVLAAIRHGADVKSTRPSPLFYAGTPEKLRILLDHGADPDAGITVGRTPLMGILVTRESTNGAFRDSLASMAMMLVEAGARLDIKDEEGRDAFHFSTDEAFKDRLQTLATKRQPK